MRPLPASERAADTCLCEQTRQSCVQPLASEPGKRRGACQWKPWPRSHWLGPAASEHDASRALQSASLEILACRLCVWPGLPELLGRPRRSHEEPSLPIATATVFSGFISDVARAPFTTGAGAPCPSRAYDAFLAHVYFVDAVVLLNAPRMSTGDGMSSSPHDTRRSGSPIHAWSQRSLRPPLRFTTSLRRLPFVLVVSSERDYRVLAAFRASLRALNRAIEDGARVAGLTVHQQGLLLALRAVGRGAVPLATLRAQLRIDDATMADLVARLRRRGLIRRRVAVGRDRRAADLYLTRSGFARLDRSVEGIRHRIRVAEDLGDLQSLRSDMDDYFRFYVARGGQRTTRRPPRARRATRPRRS